MREPDNGHHRDRRNPGLFAVLGRIVEREKRRSILAAAIRIAVDLETAAVGGETGKIGVTGAAGLTSLPGITRQSACWGGKFNDEKRSHEQNG